ncbi:hypothetical protein [Staphylococcus americanisciuri]|uniref:Uncharacterized protein n=1 Tax=Staphylococcus americanisciuri TaxID=2973940 RepID=A0ABT2F0U5_9STAP|nr:hypothetical protein [Staphylococcus americanisciuri]MCS4486063.1 hypothetical protein [Staphylococcus americanisciuri]
MHGHLAVVYLLIGLFGSLAGCVLIGQLKFMCLNGTTSRLAMWVVDVIIGLFVRVNGWTTSDDRTSNSMYPSGIQGI